MSKRKLILSALLILALAIPALAQLNRGTFTGQVSDSSGAVIPGVKVTIRSTDTGTVTTTQTNDSGLYNAPNLPTGGYELAFEAPSFKVLVRSGVTLRATEVLRVDATLEVGQVTESVQVTAEVPRLQTDAPEVGTSLANRDLIDLPLSFSGARIAENFAYKLAPGVSGNSWTSNINGGTSFSKETLLDGATVTTYLSGHFGESSVSVEALQEFKIQTSGISAEFGRVQTGVFNYIMKSGTNDYHGSAYGGLRNEALNANTWVNNYAGLKRPRERRFNYAGSFGGPIWIPKVYNGKNKSFFYFTYEKYSERQKALGAASIAAPQPEWYNGDLSRLLTGTVVGQDALGRDVFRGAIYDPATFRQLPSGRWVGDMFPGNRIPVSRFSQVARNVNAIAQKHYLPTERSPDGTIPLQNNMQRPAANTPEFDQHQLSIKGDQMLTDSHRLSGSYSYIARPRLLLDQARLWDINDPIGGPLTSARRQRIKSQLIRLAEDWNVTPTILNNFIVHYNRMANPNVGAFRNIDGAKELGIKNLSTYGYPFINWGGGPFVTLGNIGDPQNDFQVYTAFGLSNTTSFSRGKHFMKVGVDIRHNHLNTRPTQGGSFNFNAASTAIPNEAFSGNQTGYAFASYLLGIVYSGGLGDPVGLGGRRRYYGAFFQDDYKVTSRLTLNLGMRWEYQPPFQEVAGRVSSWSPTVKDPISGLPGGYQFGGNCAGCTGKNSFGNPKRFRDWGPRIGLAYRPADKWTIRAGYGIFFEGDLFNGFSGTPLGKATSVQVGGTWNLNQDPVNPWAGIFNWDQGLPLNRYIPPVYDVSWGNVNRPGMIDPDYGKSPYVQSWNVNIQRELPWKVVLDVGYVANKSTGLRANGDIYIPNQLPYSAMATQGRNLTAAVRSQADADRYGIKYPYPGYSGTVAGALRQYPQVQGIQTINVYGAPWGMSTFHSMQIIVNRQFSKGLTAYGNFVWSRNMTNLSSSMVGDNGGRPLDFYNRELEKSISSDDIPRNVKGYVSYELPFGRGRTLGAGASGLWNALISGWSINAIVNYFDGTPLGFGGSFPLSGGWNGRTNRANIAAGPLKVANFDRDAFNYANRNAAVSNTYLNKSIFTDAAPLTLGSSAPFYVQARNFGQAVEDLGFQKNTTINERFRMQIRCEFLNAFNRHYLGGIITSVTAPNFGQVTGISGNRTVQLGARLDF